MKINKRKKLTHLLTVHNAAAVSGQLPPSKRARAVNASIIAFWVCNLAAVWHSSCPAYLTRIFMHGQGGPSFVELLCARLNVSDLCGGVLSSAS